MVAEQELEMCDLLSKSGHRKCAELERVGKGVPNRRSSMTEHTSSVRLVDCVTGQGQQIADKTAEAALCYNQSTFNILHKIQGHSMTFGS